MVANLAFCLPEFSDLGANPTLETLEPDQLNWDARLSEKGCTSLAIQNQDLSNRINRHDIPLVLLFRFAVAW
jgi:hypothetical protein